VYAHGSWFRRLDARDTGERWQKHREMFERQFRPAVASTYWPIQRKEAHRLIRNILETPGDLIEHLRQLALFSFNSCH
jgi:cytochrome P450